MKKYLLTLILFISLVITIPVFASTFEGTVTTGVSTGNGVNGIVIEKPTADPVAGIYTSTQNVTLTGGAGTVSIHYTMDGTTATCSSGDVYSSPIEVSTSIVIEAVSCYPNNTTSPKLTSAYVINPPASSGGGGGGGGGVTTTPANSPEDFNSDGEIDLFDFNILMNNWGTTSGATKEKGDANSDGKVDILDFNLLIINWLS